MNLKKYRALEVACVRVRALSIQMFYVHCFTLLAYIAPCIVISQWWHHLRFLNLKFGGISMLGGMIELRKKYCFFTMTLRHIM